MGFLPLALDVALMKMRVAWEREIGHPDAEEDGKRVATIEARLAGATWPSPRPLAY